MIKVILNLFKIIMYLQLQIMRHKRKISNRTRLLAWNKMTLLYMSHPRSHSHMHMKCLILLMVMVLLTTLRLTLLLLTMQEKSIKMNLRLNQMIE